MAPVSLKIVLDDGAVTRKVKFESLDTVEKAYEILKDKIVVEPGKDYGLFLRSADDELAGIWLERHRNLDYYMLRDGDSLDYICKSRVLRVRMLDGAVKTLQVDQSKTIANLMMDVCSRIGITNHDEYGLCRDEEDEPDEGKEPKQAPSTTTTLKRKIQHKEKDPQLELLSKKLKTDDNVEWLEQHKTLREMAVDPTETLLLKRRLFYSDRNVDSRDPVQLNLLYLQARDAILNGRHPVTEEQAVDCKVRWINIRDVHRRICRKKATEPDNKSKPYKYEKEIAFMKAYYKDVVPFSTPEEEEDKNYDQWNDQALDSDSSNVSEEKIKKPAAKRHRSKKAQDKSYEELEKPAPTSFVEAPTDFDSTDPVDAFLLSIGASLKMFSPYHLNLAKSKIFAVVQEHELQQIMQKQSSDVKVVSDIVYD